MEMEEENLEIQQISKDIESTESIEEQILVEAEKIKIEDDRIRDENREILKQRAIQKYYREKYIDKIHIFIALVGGLFSWVVIYATGNLDFTQMLIRVIIVIITFYCIGLILRSYIKKKFLLSEKEILAYLGFEERALEYERMQKREEELRKLQEEKRILEQKLKEKEESLDEFDLNEQFEDTNFEEDENFKPNLNYDEEPDFSTFD